MLLQRVITALILLALFLPALFAQDTTPFMGLTLLLVAAGAWEWARLNQVARPLVWLSPLLCLLAAGLAWQSGWTLQAPAGIWWLTGGLWGLLSVWMLARGVPGWARWPRGLRWVLGLVLIGMAWLALVQARHQGINFLLSCLLLVWAADIGAYFAGRSFGGRWIRARLAPAISPAKSWEGVLGGALAVCVVALLWLMIDRHGRPDSLSLYSRLLDLGAGPALLALLWMTAMSVVGDLVESLVKRSAQVKDSSGLLPGHGGVLDRLDALLPTLPLAIMLTQWSASHV